eukprot:2378184-Rhodomonas_salina.1
MQVQRAAPVPPAGLIPPHANTTNRKCSSLCTSSARSRVCFRSIGRASHRALPGRLCPHLHHRPASPFPSHSLAVSGISKPTALFMFPLEISLRFRLCPPLDHPSALADTTLISTP